MYEDGIEKRGGEGVDNVTSLFTVADDAAIKAGIASR